MDIALGAFIGGFTSLAKTIYEVWSGISDRRERIADRDFNARQREMDREHEERLQIAQHQHELLLLERKKDLPTPPVTPHENNSVTSFEDPFLSRLYADAVKLSQKNFEVVFEQFNESYGLALVLENGSVIAFILSRPYPFVPPATFLKEEHTISQIDFDISDWSPEFFLAEIVEAISDTIN